MINNTYNIIKNIKYKNKKYKNKNDDFILL